jgi:hypothetical protein
MTTATEAVTAKGGVSPKGPERTAHHACPCTAFDIVRLGLNAMRVSTSTIRLPVHVSMRSSRSDRRQRGRRLVMVCGLGEGTGHRREHDRQGDDGRWG